MIIKNCTNDNYKNIYDIGDRTYIGYDISPDSISPGKPMTIRPRNNPSQRITITMTESPSCQREILTEKKENPIYHLIDNFLEKRRKYIKKRRGY